MTKRNMPLVCVTGGTGFIGSHITRILLDRGYAVRLLVREASIRTKDALLIDFANMAKQFEVQIYNLLDLDSCVRGVLGANYVIHAASQYKLDVEDSAHDLVKVAETGTSNILEAVLHVEGVSKLVVTSSIAAVTDQPKVRVYDESDWNKKSSLKRNPYYFAKTRAERLLWDELKRRHTKLQVTAINPSMTIGPSFTNELNESNRVLAELLGGNFPGQVDLAWNLVDVRDVALAHVLAMECAWATGRLLCTNKTLHLRDLVALLRKQGFEKYALPRIKLDHPLVSRVIRLASYLDKPGKGSYLRTHLGAWPQYNNQRIQSTLGLKFRPIEDTLLETAANLVRWGHVQEIK